jgi:hypothetical protein
MLRSFWFVISFLSGLTVMLLAVCFGRLWLISAGALLTVLLGALVFVQERFIWRLYGAWNYRLAQPLSAVSRRFVLKLCYFVIFTAVGRTGSRLALTGRGTSAWAPRSSLSPDAYFATFAGPGAASGGWMRQYLRWAFHSGNSWAASLLPFIVLLRLFSSPTEEKPAEANIYTLF